MILTGRLGKFCACARLDANQMTALIAIAAAARAHRSTLMFMRFLPLPEPGALYTRIQSQEGRPCPME
jgi:hypothetical protein